MRVHNTNCRRQPLYCQQGRFVAQCTPSHLLGKEKLPMSGQPADSQIKPLSVSPDWRSQASSIGLAKKLGRGQNKDHSNWRSIQDHDCLSGRNCPFNRCCNPLIPSLALLFVSTTIIFGSLGRGGEYFALVLGMILLMHVQPRVSFCVTETVAE